MRVLIWTPLAVVTAAFALAGCATAPRQAPRTQWRSFERFDAFERTQSNGMAVLVSPRLDVRAWDELVVSLNAICPPGSALRIEARAFNGEVATRFYTVAEWTAAPGPGRTSFKGERDSTALMDTDTLICRRPMSAAQVRVTLTGTNGMEPELKFMGLSFLNSSAPTIPLGQNQHAWGRVLDVPERSQLGYPGGSGWCSPTSLSMMLAYWSRQLNRPELDVPVPDVAKAVYDTAYRGTGNWAFNMAYAGGFPGMRAFATRLEDFRFVEDCIEAGVPVALSVSFDLLNGKDKDQNNGHLIVVVGFTENGDVVVNDPWPAPKKENRVRKIFPRAQVIKAWQRSRQTAYFVYPQGTKLPFEL